MGFSLQSCRTFDLRTSSQASLSLVHTTPNTWHTSDAATSSSLVSTAKPSRSFVLVMSPSPGARGVMEMAQSRATSSSCKTEPIPSAFPFRTPGFCIAYILNISMVPFFKLSRKSVRDLIEAKCRTVVAASAPNLSRRHSSNEPTASVATSIFSLAASTSTPSSFAVTTSVGTPEAAETMNVK